MASRPGILTDWPWKPLGSSKYLILAPWMVHSTISSAFKGEKERDLVLFLIFPIFLLLRMLHHQIWISVSRYMTAKGNNRIVDKGLEFDQVDRELNWDDHILFSGVLFYITQMILPEVHHVPLWNTKGIIFTVLLHMGPVEFLYYWFHRALHHHFLYSRYHSHHHSSIVTQPISSFIHPFAEHMGYFVLFTIPLYATALTGTASIASYVGYVTFIDFMNNMGHCNFEFIPNSLFTLFPPLKYLIYTPSFHSLHHTQFRTNLSLFMPLYDYMYGTMDKSSFALYQTSLKRKQHSAVDVVHLTHLTTPQSIYHQRIGFASLASYPFTNSPSKYSECYLTLLSPLTYFSLFFFTWFYGHTFVLDSNSFNKLKLQSWLLPKYNQQYSVQRQREAINSLIEEAIEEADHKGVKVVTLGLLNQSEELNRYGEIYIERHPEWKTKVVDGSSLAAAVVINSIPKGTTRVLLRGNISKTALTIAFALCQMDIQVAVMYEDDYKKLRMSNEYASATNLVLTKNYEQKIWLAGDGLTVKEQQKASKGTLILPFSQMPPNKVRDDCYYHCTPAMITPKSLENLHSCENWLPRKVMSAWRVAGIVHALEEWEENECGTSFFSIHKVWQAALHHGFQPLPVSLT